MTNKGDVLDDGSMINHTDDYTFSHGPNFGWPGRILSGILGAYFFVFLILPIFLGDFISPIIGLVLITPTLFFMTAHTGVQLCTRTRYFREYSSFAGIKYGKWKSSRGLSDIAILTIRKKRQVRSSFGANVLGLEDIETGVYYLIPSHRKRVLINVCKNKKEADQVAQELATAMDKNFTVFNPQLSESTKSRRYR